MQFKKAQIPVVIGFDKQNRIDVLWFGAPQRKNASLRSLAQEIKSTAKGDVSVFVTIDGQTVLDDKSQRAMAVGSAFKLVVLKAYEDAIKAGEFKRNDVIRLQDSDRSLPSGTLQVLSADTLVTLETLAQLRIKISDNTATDNLIRALGKERLEALSPGNIPFLTMREFFQLIATSAESLGNNTAHRGRKSVVRSLTTSNHIPCLVLSR